MFEHKIIISYIVVCVAYSLCRIHYLLTVRSDDEFNSMLEELISLSGSKDIIKSLVILQLILSPITAPYSILRLIFKHIFKIGKKD